MSNNTKRDELAAVIVEAYGEDEGECPCEQDLDVAAHILAAGYRKILTLAGSPVLLDVADERERQNSKWGEQNHPNGTGSDKVFWAGLMSKSKTYSALATRTTQVTDDNAKVGLVTFADILLEEVFEALAEEDQARLRTELIQVAAVATQWVEAIDKGKQ